MTLSHFAIFSLEDAWRKKMNNIQLGIDLATSVSVIGAAVYFVINTTRQAKASRIFTVRKQRIEQMSQIISDFSGILELGNETIQYIRKVQDGAEEFDPKKVDFTLFCVTVDSYIRIKQKLLFAVWATNEEKEIIKEILKLTHKWNKQYVEASKNQDTKNVPDFVKLTEDIGEKVFQLSEILRKEVEKSPIF